MKIYNLDHELQILKAKYESLREETKQVISNSISGTTSESYHKKQNDELSGVLLAINEVLHIIGKTQKESRLSDFNYVTSEILNLRSKI